MNFYISDTHFGHENIIKFCKRPFSSLEEMDDTLVNNWNAVVKPGDTVRHTGDFSYKKSAHLYTKRLNGKIILIQGNHDKETQCKGHFAEIHRRLETTINGKKVLMSHYPWKHLVGEYDHKYKDRMPDIKDYPDTWLLSGHTHNNASQFPVSDHMINLGVELWNYTPVSEEFLSQFIK